MKLSEVTRSRAPSPRRWRRPSCLRSLAHSGVSGFCRLNRRNHRPVNMEVQSSTGPSPGSRPEPVRAADFWSSRRHCSLFSVISRAQVSSPGLGGGGGGGRADAATRVAESSVAGGRSDAVRRWRWTVTAGSRLSYRYQFFPVLVLVDLSVFGLLLHRLAVALICPWPFTTSIATGHRRQTSILWGIVLRRQWPSPLRTSPAATAGGGVF